MFYEITPQSIYNINTKITYKEIICDNSIKSQSLDYLRQMHSLRYNVFVKSLGWTYGFEVINKMEFDQYDNSNSTYVVHINKNNKVDGAVRFIKTNTPYMLKEHYSHFVEDTSLPNNVETFEVTRLVAAPETCLEDKIFSKLVSVCIDWGLRHNCIQAVALTRNALRPLTRAVGWPSTPLGEPRKTPDDISIALKFDINKKLLNTVCTRNDIPPPQVQILTPT